ncbi:MAG TPA: hypothetical protein VEK38_01910, partial [Candidatus Bathyarchaeia archaeon]|nr:hypothetical protein [Candidatus Bathyarchaeia archaeon]
GDFITKKVYTDPFSLFVKKVQNERQRAKDEALCIANRRNSQKDEQFSEFEDNIMTELLDIFDTDSALIGAKQKMPDTVAYYTPGYTSETLTSVRKIVKDAKAVLGSVFSFYYYCLEKEHAIIEKKFLKKVQKSLSELVLLSISRWK